MRSGFTLIELLVVIAIIAILSVTVVLALNPAELLRQSRDSNRLADMSSLATVLGVFTSQSSGFLGTSSVIYVSIPDPTATSSAGDQCQGLGLLALPSSSYSYHCAASAYYRKVDGTGWIPVNFTSLSGGSPLGQLPIDPTNASSSRTYYTYATNGSQYEVTMAPESAKYKLGGSNDVVAGDNGTLASVYEAGNKLGLEPLDYGDNSLLGYWTFEEGSSSVAYDYSGNNATGSWNGTATGTFGYYAGGKIGNYAGAFDGVSTFTSISSGSSAFNLTNAVTMVAWVKMTTGGADEKVISKRPSYVLTVFNTNIPETEVFISTASNDDRGVAGGTTMATGTWYQVAGTYDGTTIKTYVNGVLDRQLAASGNMDTVTYPLTLGRSADTAVAYWNGLIDDARVYNRVLSAAEIAALFNGKK